MNKNKEEILFEALNGVEDELVEEAAAAPAGRKPKRWRPAMGLAACLCVAVIALAAGRGWFPDFRSVSSDAAELSMTEAAVDAREDTERAEEAAGEAAGDVANEEEVGAVGETVYGEEAEEDATVAETAASTGNGEEQADTELVEMFLCVMEELWNMDEGLNDGATFIAVDFQDFTENGFLSQSDIDELTALAEERFGIAVREAGYEELLEEGDIDEEYLYLIDGVLFEIRYLGSDEEDSFSFAASKWVSGTGAIWFDDCEAVRTEEGWEYTLDGFAIS